MKKGLNSVGTYVYFDLSTCIENKILTKTESPTICSSIKLILIDHLI